MYARMALSGLRIPCRPEQWPVNQRAARNSKRQGQGISRALLFMEGNKPRKKRKGQEKASANFLFPRHELPVALPTPSVRATAQMKLHM